MIEGSYTIYAKELIDKGFTPEVIIEELKEIREQAGAYLIVDDLEFTKSGRITGAQAWVGTLLKMKPVLRFEKMAKFILLKRYVLKTCI